MPTATKEKKPTTVVEAALYHNVSEEMICPGCLTPSGWLDGGPCMACTRARQRGACGGRCQCGNKRRPHYVKTDYRAWWSCHRCLATISGYTPTAKDLAAYPEAKEEKKRG